MIYWKLIVTDQSYEVSCQDINVVPCHFGTSFIIWLVHIVKRSRVKI